MPISYEAFHEFEAAHLTYAKGLPAADAFDVLSRRLEDGSWRQAPDCWDDLLRWLAHYAPELASRLDELALGFAQALSRPVDDGPRFSEALASALPQFCAWALNRDPRIVSAFVQSLRQVISPGEAGIVSGILQHRQIEHLHGPLRPLVEWMLASGVAELRGSGSRAILPRLLVAAEDPAALASAVDLVALTHGPMDITSQVNERWAAPLWDRLERFDPSGPSEAAVTDLLVRFGELGLWSQWFPGPARHPRCSRLVLRPWLEDCQGFAHDFVSDLVLSIAPEPSDLLNVPLAKLTGAVEKLQLSRSERREQPQARAWAKSLATALIRGAGGVGRINRPGVLGSLFQLSGWPGPAGGVEDALRDALADGRPSLVQQLLDSNVPEHLRVWSALRAFVAAPPSAAVADLPAAFEHHLVELVNGTWRGPIFGIDAARLLGGVRRVRFAELDRDLAVDVRGDTLWVHTEYPRALAGSVWSDEERLALLSLYVVHEMIHALQGVGEKAVVGRMRETGNEHALMHLDLGADHAAAQIVGRVFSRWDLQWLKDVQGRSIADFPATPLHPFGSRMRKAMRLCGLRLDYLVRRHVRELLLGDGYVFAAFGATAGPFQVLTSGPPPTVLLERRVTADQARMLLTCLDPLPQSPGKNVETRHPIDRLDDTLLAILGVTR